MTTSVDDLTDEQLTEAVMRLRGITDPAALNPAALQEVSSLIRAVEVVVTLPGEDSKVSARIPGKFGPLLGWVTEVDENPVRAMMRAYLKAAGWPNC